MVDLPKFHQFMLPMLRVIAEKGELSRQEAIDEVIKRTGLTTEQISSTHDISGQSVARGRISWAASHLKLAGGITQPRRGVFDRGPRTQEFLNLGRALTVSDLKATSEWKEYEEQKAFQGSASEESSDKTEIADATPEDLIEAGFSQLRKQLVAELLERVKSMSPEAFESLVLLVLSKMGYGGGDFQSMQTVPRGPDGGIDGRINEDKLGLDQIYIQAKRYSDNPVGRPTVQSFVGAMTGGGCKKGVFVTSSAFTSDARKFASDLRDQRLVLIDGAGFARLMIDYGVGVQIKETYPVAKIDQDFFSDDDE